MLTAMLLATDLFLGAWSGKMGLPCAIGDAVAASEETGSQGWKPERARPYYKKLFSKLHALSSPALMTPELELPGNDGSLIATELVFIDSSPINIAGLPKARVLKRKDNHYMLPSSPSSPTLNMRRKSDKRTSENQVARAKRDYIRTDGKYCITVFSPVH